MSSCSNDWTGEIPGSSSQSENTTAFYILLWILFVVFLIVAVASRSVLVVALVVLCGVALAIAQCFFRNPKGEEVDFSDHNNKHVRKNGEIAFEMGKRHSDCTEENVQHAEDVHAVANAIYRPSERYVPGTNIGAVECASRGNWSGDCGDPTNEEGWVAGYEDQPWCDSSDKLREIANDAMTAGREETGIQYLPQSCSTKPRPCDMSVAWQPSFVGCSSTFVPSPHLAGSNGCPLYKKDARAWPRRLDEEMYRRSIVSGEIWDPYKHFEARQKFAQFISEDMVHRKDQWMRPIETLDQSSGERVCGGDSLAAPPACAVDSN